MPVAGTESVVAISNPSFLMFKIVNTNSLGCPILGVGVVAVKSNVQYTEHTFILLYA